MNRVTRDGHLPSDEADRYDNVRAKIKEELPDLIKRHQERNMSNKPMTLDEVIEALQQAKEQSNLKGNAVVHICIQEVSYIPVVRINAENDDSGGCVILVHPEFQP